MSKKYFIGNTFWVWNSHNHLWTRYIKNLFGQTTFDGYASEKYGRKLTKEERKTILKMRRKLKRQR